MGIYRLKSRVITPSQYPFGYAYGKTPKYLITIDHTKIDSTLSDFPIMIYLSATSGQGRIFDDLGVNSKKIIVKNSSGIQLYCEIEEWDALAKKAVLHVKVDSISSFADTVLTLEWNPAWADNVTYIGDTGDAAAESVWDSNFTAIYHMAQDPSGGTGCILDSTSNNHNGTPNGSMTSGDLVDADYGKAIDFDGIDDSIGFPAYSGGSITVEMMARIDNAYRCNLWIQSVDTNTADFWLGTDSTNQAMFSIKIVTQERAQDSSALSTGYHYLSGAYDADNIKLFVDTTKFTGSKTISPAGTGTQAIGVFSGNTSYGGWADIKAVEARLSNIMRSDAWMKATNYSLKNELISIKTGT